MSTRLRLALLAVLGIVLAGVLIAACRKGEDEKAGDAAVAVYEAIGEDDAEAFCQALSSSVHEEFTKLKIGGYVELGKPPTCESNFELFRHFYADSTGNADAAEVDDVSLNGDRAVVALAFGEDERLEGGQAAPRTRLRLVKEGDDWKLADLNIPGPPAPNAGGEEGGDPQ